MRGESGQSGDGCKHLPEKSRTGNPYKLGTNMASEQIPNAPSHALRIIDNWDGESDQEFILAFQRNGDFYRYENGKPVLEYRGDQILQSWPLTPNTVTKEST
jgi:hypothetical protein